MILTSIQNIMWPSNGIPINSFIRGGEYTEETLFLKKGEEAEFGGYMNCFDAGLWRRCTNVCFVGIIIKGQGSFDLTCYHHDRAPAIVLATTPLKCGEAYWLKLPEIGQLSLTLRAQNDAVIENIAWMTDLEPHRIKVGLCVTQFHRETEVTSNLMHFKDLDVTCIVIDNSRSMSPNPNFVVIPNPNLGGAGGFARALSECKSRQITHAIFMDDDAATPLESVRRTLAFLSFANSSQAAVSGAMVSELRPNELWENGATFYKRCKPIAHRQSFGNFNAIYRMLSRQNTHKPYNFYGGWWFFAFPISAVQSYPFPYFVRGDDICFSLSNSFQIEMLPGVFAMQADFAVKESAFSLYLDLRNHLHHHLVQQSLTLGRVQLAKLAVSFIGRSVFRMHYASARALILAWHDIMAGPSSFSNVENTISRRNQISDFSGCEKFQSVREITAPIAQNRRFNRIFSILSLNGLLIPGFKQWGKVVTIPVHMRGAIWPFAMARKAIIQSSDQQKSYIVHHNKREAFSIGLSMVWHLLKWLFLFTSVREKHRIGFLELTTSTFWEKQFLKQNQRYPIKTRYQNSL